MPCRKAISKMLPAVRIMLNRNSCEGGVQGSVSDLVETGRRSGVVFPMKLLPRLLALALDVITAAPWLDFDKANRSETIGVAGGGT
jgi:hypothetical protein